MFEELSHRIDVLEARNRRLRRLSLLAVLLVVGCVTMGQATTGDTQELVKARNLHLVDAAGEPRILFGTEEEGPAGMVIKDAAGTARAMVGVAADGSPVIRLSDRQGRLRASLVVATDGEPAIELRDASGRVRLRATTVDGQPGVALMDGRGEERIEIASLDGGENGIALNGPDGVLYGVFGTAELVRLVAGGATVRGAAGVVTCDRAGQVLGKTPKDY